MSVLKSERAYGQGRFCSHECLSAWMSETRRGRAHHQWEGGAGRYRGLWWKARREALERDEYTCQHCGTGAAELGRNPDVHHIVPISEFEDLAEAHELSNLVSLCPACHTKAEAGTIELGGEVGDGD